MAKISKAQMQFLQTQSISLSRVFDATGMARSSYQAVMNELDMVVAVGVTPCKKAGHKLRTRAGHCAQCDTAKLAFLLRYVESGEVYVAVSERSGLVKIGAAKKNSHARMNSLNGQGYGDITDWEVHFHQACNQAGKVEFLAQRSLNGHRISKTYVKAGNTVDCQELFNCGASDATAAIQAALKQVTPSASPTSPCSPRSNRPRR